MLVLTGMTDKYSCLEIIRVIEQCRVYSGWGDSRLGAERRNFQLVCLLHFLARYHDSFISLPATDTKAFSSFSRDLKLTKDIVLNGVLAFRFPLMLPSLFIVSWIAIKNVILCRQLQYEHYFWKMWKVHLK